MLMSVILLYLPFNWMVVMLFVSGTFMISQFAVSSAVLTQVTDLTCVPSLPLFSGKTGLKFVGILIALNVLMMWGSGSWISTISQSLPTLL
jgi:hypothetical protein